MRSPRRAGRGRPAPPPTPTARGGGGGGAGGGPRPAAPPGAAGPRAPAPPAHADAELRAELLLAWLLGLSLVHPLLPDGSIGRSDPDDVLVHVRRTAAALLDGPLTR